MVSDNFAASIAAEEYAAFAQILPVSLSRLRAAYAHYAKAPSRFVAFIGLLRKGILIGWNRPGVVKHLISVGPVKPFVAIFMDGRPWRAWIERIDMCDPAFFQALGKCRNHALGQIPAIK